MKKEKALKIIEETIKKNLKITIYDKNSDVYNKIYEDLKANKLIKTDPCDCVMCWLNL